jgi:transcriptional regulator with XRE-family HTH domain
MTNDLGKRITAARAYAGIDRETLADGVSLTPTGIQRLEAGLDELTHDERRSTIQQIAAATRLPEQFFTVDYAELAGETTPERRLDQLDATLKSMDGRLARIAAKLGIE